MSLSLAAAAITAAPLLTVPPALASTPTVRAEVTYDRLDPKREVTLTVRASDPAGVRSVRAALTRRALGEPTFQSVDGFTRTSGSDTDSTWTAKYTADTDRHPGPVSVLVTVVNADGTSKSQQTGYTDCYVTEIEATAPDKRLSLADPDAAVDGRRTVRTSRDDAPGPSRVGQ
ncbi:hypothetical protein [Actinomadura atramentaria]|uniref:hypothetical protein n=1 Tax=Actinomadura atramentaria TaxID=1990 RepID=UPI00036F1947|nr:hypothetical protein [Actinomadura atramentaria]